MAKILVVDDHALVREGLLVGLRGLGPDAQLFGAADASAANAFLENERIDLLLLDLMLPSVQGLSYLRVVRRRFPDLRVLVLSALCDPETVSGVMKAGAVGFVSKSSSVAELLDCLQVVLTGGTCVPPGMEVEVTRSDAAKKNGNHLEKRFGVTPAQSRVLELMGEGLGNRAIAELLGVTEGTVKIHVSAILKSMGVKNRSEVALAVNRKRR